MVNEHELLINIVTIEKPKMLTGFTKKVSGQDMVLEESPYADDVLPVKRQNLTHPLWSCKWNMVSLVRS
jgi:hypothetical protein